jgi:hypothetical protein
MLPPPIQGDNINKINSYQVAMVTRQGVKQQDLFCAVHVKKHRGNEDKKKQSMGITDITAM